jgi:hypothetical protein
MSYTIINYQLICIFKNDVSAIGNPSSSLATPDNKYEGALSEEAVCRMKNYTGTSPVDPRHLVMDLQSFFSEGSTKKSNVQDLSRHEEKESCVSVPMQNGGKFYLCAIKLLICKSSCRAISCCQIPHNSHRNH